MRQRGGVRPASPMTIPVVLLFLLVRVGPSSGHDDQMGVNRLFHRMPKILARLSRKLPDHYSRSGHDDLGGLNRIFRRRPKTEAGLWRKNRTRSNKNCSQICTAATAVAYGRDILRGRVSKIASSLATFFELVFKTWKKVATNFFVRDHYKQKRRVALWTRQKQRRFSRKAYRMAILASLAYYDFHDTKRSAFENGNITSYNPDNSNWAFSLADDPSPAQCLIKNNGSSHSLRSLSLGKKRNPMLRIHAGIVARFRVSLCQTHYKADRLAQTYDKLTRLVPAVTKVSKSSQTTNITAAQQCKQQILQKHENGKRYNVEWALSNWYEQEGAIRWHDTDLIIASSGTSEIVLAFAGTASAADAVTNLQTLERASHSGLFNQNADVNYTNITLEGNIHRGFLNAYARVSRGKIQKLKKNQSTSIKSLDDLFNECVVQQSRPQKYSTAAATIKQKTPDNAFKKMKDKMGGKKIDAASRRKNRVCLSEGNRLMDILRNVTISSLKSGKHVHVVGHSLAGSLATMHALDIVMNHVDTPVDRLHLWTFGAPEIADSLFFESAGKRSPRLRDFIGDEARVHRYVTQSEKNGDRDPVASITSKSLNRRGLRRIGGVRGNVVHPIEPMSLSCNVTGAELHEIRSYLSGISSSFSPKHLLNTDFPAPLKGWLGESLEERVSL